ncbi:ArsR/SmtB family transcription factor [Sphingomonas sabuli]|uniref:ArsR/SmtB family transcription factor n=1 Tax=Sphingomonas sabuli TaxID=2764186 RepID=UPI001CA406C8|nr:metalloregulator ArsR/SmtB family transcription factor [Sphingomonas sabuli]
MKPAAIDALFHALGDPTRRGMLAMLARRTASVSELADHLSISKTAVGQHLAVLEGVSLARSAKKGRVRTCEFDVQGLATLQEWIEFHRREWGDRLDRLDTLLEDGEI